VAAHELHGGSGEVRDVDVGSGERREDHGLAYVGIAGQNDGVDALSGCGAGRV